MNLLPWVIVADESLTGLDALTVYLLDRYTQGLHSVGGQNLAAVTVGLFLISVVYLDDGILILQEGRYITDAGEIGGGEEGHFFDYDNNYNND